MSRLSPPGVSPRPTIPPSVFSSTTLRRKYGPWQPLAASSGGSGNAIGVTFSPVIVKRRFPRHDPARPAHPAAGPATAPGKVTHQSRRLRPHGGSRRDAGTRASVAQIARQVTA